MQFAQREYILILWSVSPPQQLKQNTVPIEIQIWKIKNVCTFKQYSSGFDFSQCPRLRLSTVHGTQIPSYRCVHMPLYS